MIAKASAKEPLSEDTIDANEEASSRAALPDWQHPSTPDVIHGGDVVRFFHLSATAFLAYDHIDENSRSKKADGEPAAGIKQGSSENDGPSRRNRRGCRHPSLHISGIPDHHRRHQNQNINCLWRLEQVCTASEGQPLPRNPPSVFPTCKCLSDTTKDMSTVRVQHIATGRYLSVVEECKRSEEYYMPCDDAPTCMTCAAPPGRGEHGVKRRTAGSCTHHVCLLPADNAATIIRSSLFVIRPRPALKAAQGCSHDGLSTCDFVHLQHQETKLFLAIRPQNEARGKETASPEGEQRGVAVCLGTVEYPLTNEVSSQLGH